MAIVDPVTARENKGVKEPIPIPPPSVTAPMPMIVRFWLPPIVSWRSMDPEPDCRVTSPVRVIPDWKVRSFATNTSPPRLLAPEPSCVKPPRAERLTAPSVVNSPPFEILMFPPITLSPEAALNSNCWPWNTKSPPVLRFC